MRETVVIIPEPDALMRDLERTAHRTGLHVITDGREILLSSLVLPGWQRMSIGASRMFAANDTNFGAARSSRLQAPA